MKKYCLVFSCFLALSAGPLEAQQLSPFVISSSGGFTSNASGMLSYTVAELSAVETFSSTGNILTQGFQQAWDFSTYLTEHPVPDFSFGIYPNPSDGNFSLVTEAGLNEKFAVKVMDVLGKVMMRIEIYQGSGIQVVPFNLSDAAEGIYLVGIQVKARGADPEKVFFKKIQIIK